MTPFFIYAYLLDGHGSGTPLNSEQVVQWQPGDGCLWIHIDYTNPGAREWLEKESRLRSYVIDTLTADEVRPRAYSSEDAVVIALRGINMTPGEAPEDMVAIRAWLSEFMMITSSNHTVMSVSDMVDAIENGSGPKNTGSFIFMLTDFIAEHIELVVDQLEERLDKLEVALLNPDTVDLGHRLTALRRESIILRRYLSPQREAMIKLSNEHQSWINLLDFNHLRDVTDRILRHTEDLESLRDRAVLTQEEWRNRITEQMNNRMYVLSVFSIIFLPLGFLTGLLGINIGGVPGTNNPQAFMWFIFILLVLLAVQLLILKRKKWF